MKYRNNLSNTNLNSLFEVTSPFKVFIPIAIYDSNTYYGSSMMFGTLYKQIDLNIGDCLYDTFGGVFVTYNGKHYPARINLSEKSPFEKTYGFEEEVYPIDKLKLIQNAEIKLNIERNLPKVNAPKKYYGRSIDSVEEFSNENR